jgi:hypothetical protein
MKRLPIPVAIFVAIVIATLGLLFFQPPPGKRGEGDVVTNLPWQIEVLPDGTSRVFGLTVGASTLSDARTRFGGGGELAIVAAPGETGSIELYFEDVTLGAVTGKLIVAADAGNDVVETMKRRAVKTEYMQSTTKKSTLAEPDAAAAYASSIRSIAFVPSISLDENIVIHRFGQPAERIRTSETTEHFLYPERGLDIALDSKGKELLQYVAPRNFARLRAPLERHVDKPEN